MLRSSAGQACLRNPIYPCAARFFDSTPSGRILNRLSRDVQVIDQDLPTSGMFWTYEILAALAIVIVISVNLPAFLIASVVITLAYAFLGQLYVTSSRELKRLGESRIFFLLE